MRLWTRSLVCLFLSVFMGHPLIAERNEKASGELRLKIIGKNLPAAPSIHVEVDPITCGSLHQTHNIQASPEGFLKNAVVWLEPSAGTPITPNEAGGPDIELRIKECEFSPRIILTAPEQVVNIKTEDSILFQIRTRGQKNLRQVKTLPPNLQQIQFRFRDPEIIPISCDLHSWMKAFVVVAPNSLYRISNDKGDVKFTKLPPGEYQLNLWHEIFGQKQWPEKILIKSKAAEARIEWDYLETDTVPEK